MSIFDGLSRPMRAAGLGLLAVAVIAAVIGGVTLVSGGGDEEPAAQQTSQSNQPGDGGQSDSPDGTDGQSPSSGNGSDGDGSDGDGSDDPNGNGSGDDNGSGNGDGSGNGSGDGSGSGSDSDDGSDSDGSAGSDDGGKQVGAGAVDVRVYNNSTVAGLAHNAAGDLRGRGWDVVEVGNYSQGVIPASTVYFRPGTGEEPAARQLADRLGMRVEKRFGGIQDSSPGVIVIVTQDYADR